MKPASRRPLAFLVVLIVAATTGVHLQARAQFLQPQSHLSRLVQAVTSPLVYSAAGYAGQDDQSSESAGYEPEQGPVTEQNKGAASQAQHFQHYQPQQSRHYQHRNRLQQDPGSQQRGPAQNYYYGQQQHRDEDQGAPSQPRQQAQEYQMGAYLGPTIDDKEINGAFNSNNDERDDDDDRLGYDGPPAGELGSVTTGNSHRLRAASSFGAGPAGLGPSHMHSGYGGASSGQAASNYNGNEDDDSGADEDEPPAARRPGHFRSSGSGLNQAASQYHHQQQRQPRGRQQQQPMMAAANGYAPYGYGPQNGIDLGGLLAAAQGDPSAGYQVFNGDGSYPGPNYYQQPGRSQAASMNQLNGYYNGQGPNGDDDNYSQPRQQPGRQPGASSDADDPDMDGDDD